MTVNEYNQVILCTETSHTNRLCINYIFDGLSDRIISVYPGSCSFPLYALLNQRAALHYLYNADSSFQFPQKFRLRFSKGWIPHLNNCLHLPKTLTFLEENVVKVIYNEVIA